MPFDLAFMRRKQAAYRRLFYTNQPKLSLFQRLIFMLLPARMRRNSMIDFNPDAQVVIEDLLKFCHVGEVVHEVDPTEMARREGKREVALNLLHILNVDLVAAVENAQTTED